MCSQRERTGCRGPGTTVHSTVQYSTVQYSNVLRYQVPRESDPVLGSCTLSLAQLARGERVAGPGDRVAVPLLPGGRLIMQVQEDPLNSPGPDGRCH